MIKYYIKLNSDDSINRPYTDEGGFVPPSGSIEVTEQLVKEYLQYKNTGHEVFYLDGALLPTKIEETPKYICAEKCKQIKDLLLVTDTTQLIDHRLTESKRQEFEDYRDSLRVLLNGLQDGTLNPVTATIPTMPQYGE